MAKVIKWAHAIAATDMNSIIDRKRFGPANMTTVRMFSILFRLSFPMNFGGGAGTNLRLSRRFFNRIKSIFSFVFLFSVNKFRYYPLQCVQLFSEPHGRFLSMRRQKCLGAASARHSLHRFSPIKSTIFVDAGWGWETNGKVQIH